MSKENVSLPVVLACGADTVYLTIIGCDKAMKPTKAVLAKELEEELEALKRQAQEEEEPVETRWAFEGEKLRMKDKGARGGAFPWILESEELTVNIGRGKRTGILGQVRLSSKYLWTCRQRGAYTSVVLDVGKALADVCVFLTSIYEQDILCKLSSIDLAIDFIKWDIGSVDWKECFVRRAQTDSPFPDEVSPGEYEMLNGPDQPFNRWNRLTGLTFGRHASAIYCKLYDKTHEIRYHAPKKIWMHQHWLARKDRQGRPLWNSKDSVWRLEASLKRDALVQLCLDGQAVIDDAFSVLEHIERMWWYCVGRPGGGADGLPDGWLRYVIPQVEDTNRSRWPVDPKWEVLQAGFAELDLSLENDVQAEQREQFQEVEDYLTAYPWKVEVKPQPTLSQHKKHQENASYVILEPPPGIDTRSFVRMCKRKVDMDRAIAAIAGWTSTVEAYRRRPDQEVTDDISGTFHYVFEHVNDYLAQRKRDFEEMVQKRRKRYRIEKR